MFVDGFHVAAQTEMVEDVVYVFEVDEVYADGGPHGLLRAVPFPQMAVESHQFQLQMHHHSRQYLTDFQYHYR